MPGKTCLRKFTAARFTADLHGWWRGQWQRDVAHSRGVVDIFLREVVIQLTVLDVIGHYGGLLGNRDH